MADYTFDKYMLFKNDLDRERVEKILQMNCPDLSYFLINAEENTFDVIKLQSGEWIIDKEKKEILCKKEKISVSEKEFQIIDFLLENAVNKFTVEEILYALNMEDGYYLKQIIDNLIKKMQKYSESLLQKAGDKYFIDT